MAVLAAAESLSSAIDEAEKISKALGMVKKGFSTKSKMAVALKDGGSLADLPQTLAPAMPDDAVEKAKWASWHFKGAGFVQEGRAVCPYCGAEGALVELAAEFDARHNPDQADAWLTVMQSAEGQMEYFAPDSVERLRLVLTEGSADEGLSQSVEEFGKAIARATAAYRAIAAIPQAPVEGPTAPTAKVLTNNVQALRCNAWAFGADISAGLSELADKAEEFLGAMGNINMIDDEWQATLQRESKDYCDQMSGFLEAAGYPYEVAIDAPKKGSASLVLVHRGTKAPVTGADNPLSYGERNALALALFYSEAIKVSDALIVLDDPISSFDGVKRFALLSALFSKRENKLLGSTLNSRFVVMLTHDPLVVHDSLKFLASRNATNAKHLITDETGIMSARGITAGDFQPCVRLIESRLADYVRSSDDPLPFCALAYIRQRFELSRKCTSSVLYDAAVNGLIPDGQFTRKYSDTLAFAMLSSLLHGDATPQLRKSGDADEPIDMPSGYASLAKDAIGDLLERCGSRTPFDFSCYSKMLAERPVRYLTDAYAESGASAYEKVLIIRGLHELDGDVSMCMDPYHSYVLDGAFHMGDLVMQLDRDEFCQVPPHIQAVCNEAFGKYMERYAE